MKPLSCALAGILLLAACGDTTQQDSSVPAPSSDATPATGVVWQWAAVQGADPARVDHPTRYTIEFLDDGRYSIRADCNSGLGSWSVEDGVLDVGHAAMTRAACGPASLDGRFLRLIDQVTGFETQGEELYLLLESGAVRMRMVAMKKIGLAGTSWLVRACNNGSEAVVSVLAGSELTMIFGADGSVSGSGGCNNFRGSGEIEGNALHIGPLASTRRMCMQEGVSDQESRFLAALEGVATWEIRGERAQLRDGNGALMVDLVSAVTGSVTYRTRQALPENAELTVQLLDVSLADVAAVLLAEQVSLTGDQQVPLTFSLPFNPAEIDPRHSYSLRANITIDGRLEMTTATSYPVLTRDGGQFGVELLLDAVGH
ncbi:hypothetical protein DRQ53_03255 [bacterium]|nr:MAG: hypothetical protein DRQ53_03255 [bacterium]